LHAAAAVICLVIYREAAIKATKTYMIDFVGPSAAIASSQGQSPAAPPDRAAAYQPQPQVDRDAFGRRRKGAPLPRPSLLRGWREAPAMKEKPAPGPEAAAGPAEPAAGAPGDAGIATDLPNFPYPWYISQLRQSLWGQWSARMPKEKGDCVVVFTLLPNGSFVDLRTEESSGDSAFDLIALSAVQDAAPFPPLPNGFKERFLKIHVTLKTL
jgi:protein TonB